MMQTELHRHLDVSIRLQTLLSLAQERNLESQSTSIEAFQNKIVLQSPLSDLTSVLARFSLCQKVFDRPEVHERVAFEAIEDCWNEGTKKVELRYSPSFVSEFSKVSWEESLLAFHRGLERGLKQYPKMKAGLICIAVRDFGAEDVDKTVEFFLNHMDRFVGLDLAGNESKFPCHLYESSFKKAIQRNAKITIHAGEASGPENVWEAIELLGARRIGHGVMSIHDPKLVEHLQKHQICLEMCPTSNWLTSAVPLLAEHPLPKLLRAGVPVCINTDDPTVFGNSMPIEIHVCREKMGMSLPEIEQCHEHGSRSSFIK